MRDRLDSPDAGAAAARGGALRITSYALGQGLALLAAALVFRHLGVDDAGRYVTVLSLAAIASGLADAGLATLAARELTDAGAGERRALLARLLGLRLILSLAAAALMVAFAAVAGYGTRMVVGSALTGFGVVLLSVQATVGAALLTRLRAGWLAVAELVRQGVGLALVVALVAAGAGLVPLFAAVPAAAACALIVTVIGTGGVRFARPGPEWRALLGSVLPFAVAAAASVAFFRVAMIEISLLGSAHDAGLFGVSFRVIEALVALPPLAVGTVFPLLVRTAGVDRERWAATLERTVVACGALGAGLALVFALGAPLVVRAVGGDAFAGAGVVLRIQSAALLASFIAAPWGFALLALHRERALAAVNVVGLVLAVGVAAALIEADGARGAAVATVVGEGGLAVSFAVLLARAGGPVALGALAPVAGALAAGGLAALVPGLSDAVRAALGAALYLGVLALARARPWRR